MFTNWMARYKFVTDNCPHCGDEYTTTPAGWQNHINDCAVPWFCQCPTAIWIGGPTTHPGVNNTGQCLACKRLSVMSADNLTRTQARIAQSVTPPKTMAS